jgi:hypothetical protein
VQALPLMKACIHRRTLETTQGAHVAELEMDNSKLLAEVELTRLAIVEAYATWNSLSLTHGKLEEECAGLRAVVETLGQEKVRAEVACEVERKRKR